MIFETKLHLFPGFVISKRELKLLALLPLCIFLLFLFHDLVKTAYPSFTYSFWQFSKLSDFKKKIQIFKIFRFFDSWIFKIFCISKFLDFSQLFKILRFSKFSDFQNSQIFKILRFSKFLDFKSLFFSSPYKKV